MLADLDRELEGAGLAAEVVVVDDGSTVLPGFESARSRFSCISRIEVLHLRRNLGHQRAIAIGLAFIHGERPCEAVVVMDADGQDRPSDVPRLVRALQEEKAGTIVFAERVRRSESLVFKVCYHGYRALHRALTGISVRVGNFSIVPFQALGSLVAVSELWNHYAAAVFKARLPFTTIPTDRAPRISEGSRMNFLALILHGMSALSVFGEVIGVRLLAASAALAVLSIIGFSTTFLWHLYSGSRTATLGIFLLGACVLLTFQMAAMAGALILGVLRGRANLTFLPVRDYRHYVRDISKIFETSRVN
jgi:glycosyltransferase involved in cell wall biosynthesis